MDFTGIIAEYDPFHNGHAAQLAAVRAAGAQCIAVCMSSGAVQRVGVPILPESVRVRAALDAGADHGGAVRRRGRAPAGRAWL